MRGDGVEARVKEHDEEIRAWANERLGKAQRLSAVELRDELPRSPIGKVLKRELREPYKQAFEARAAV